MKGNEMFSPAVAALFAGTNFQQPECPCPSAAGSRVSTFASAPIWGLGEVSVAAAGSASLTQAPTSPGLWLDFVINAGTLASNVLADLLLEALTIGNVKYQVELTGGDATGAGELFNEDSECRPLIGAWAEGSTSVTATMSSLGTTTAILGSCRMIGVADPTRALQNIRPRRRGLIVALGGASGTGLSIAGKPNVAVPFEAEHICVQQEADDLLYTALALGSDQYLCGGSAPSSMFDRRNPKHRRFGFRRRVVDSGTQFTLTLASGTSGSLGASLTGSFKE